MMDSTAPPTENEFETSFWNALKTHFIKDRGISWSDNLLLLLKGKSPPLESDNDPEHILAPSISQKFATGITSIWHLSSTGFFIGAATRFPQIANAVENTLNYLYFKLSIEKTIRDALRLDAATVSSEAFFLITQLVIYLGSGIIGYWIYQGVQYRLKKAPLEQLLAKLKTQFPELNNNSSLTAWHYAGDDISREELKRLLDFANNPDTLTAETEEQIKTILKKPASRTFIEATKFNRFTKNAGKYIYPLVLSATIVGYFFFESKSQHIEDFDKCDSKSGIWNMLTNGCPLSVALNSITMTIYPWLASSGTGLLTRSIVVVIYPMKVILEKLRPTLFTRINKLDERFEKWWHSPERNLYSNFLHANFMLFGLPLAVAYSLNKAYKQAKQLTESMKCVSLSTVVTDVFLGRTVNEGLCEASNKALLAAVWIATSEMGGILPIYTAASLGIFLLATTMNRIPFFQKDNIRAIAQNILKKLDHIKAVILTPAAIIGIVNSLVWFLPAVWLANDVFKGGLIADVDEGGFYIREQIIDGCDQSIIPVFFKQIPNSTIDCDPFLLARAKAAFIAVYWMAFSYGLGFTYLGTNIILATYSAALYSTQKVSTWYHMPLARTDSETDLLINAEEGGTHKRSYGRSIRDYFSSSGPSFWGRASQCWDDMANCVSSCLSPSLAPAA